MGIISFFTKGKKNTLAILGENGRASEDYDVEYLESEEHEWKNEITNFPLENGGNISDHIIKLPKRVRISGLTSDSPIDVFGVIAGFFSKPDSQKAVSFFENMRDSQKFCSVSTKLKSYDKMACESVNISRGSSSGNSMRYDVVLVEVTTVDTLLEDLSSIIKGAKDATGALKKTGSGSAAKDMGKASNVSASPSAANQSGSILSNLLGM